MATALAARVRRDDYGRLSVKRMAVGGRGRWLAAGVACAFLGHACDTPGYKTRSPENTTAGGSGATAGGSQTSGDAGGPESSAATSNAAGADASGNAGGPGTSAGTSNAAGAEASGNAGNPGTSAGTSNTASTQAAAGSRGFANSGGTSNTAGSPQASGDVGGPGGLGGTSNTAGTQTLGGSGGSRDGTGGAQDTATGGASGSTANGPYGWELPFLLHYFGEGDDHDVYTVAVDDKNLYWRATGNRIMVMPKEGGEPEPFVVCPSCEFLPKPDDSGFVYFLDGAQLLQVDRETRKEVRIDLPWSHAGGALLAEGEYVYTAMPGCAAILRISRSTWTIEEMYVDGVASPGRGHTTLVRSGEAIVCGSPTDVYAFEKWGAPANHLSSDGDCAFDLVVVDGFVHWWQTPSGNLPDSIGTVPLSGGAVTWADMEKLGGSSEIAYVPPADAVVTGTLRGLQGFSRDTGIFDFQVGADKVLSLDADDSAVFCAFTGKRFRVVDGVNRQDWPYWLARIPFEAIVEAQQAR